MSQQTAPIKAPSHRALNMVVWSAQALLFASFVWAGWMKITTPIPQLAAMWTWTGDLPSPLVRILGLVDLAGGLGVLLPSLTGIRPSLTVIAAAGCIALQICAMLFHISRGEISVTPVNGVFLILAVLVFWGRRKIPIGSR
jgi:uncharacterized membrane protein YphA (DoxX/SURF4 family)